MVKFACDFTFITAFYNVYKALRLFKFLYILGYFCNRLVFKKKVLFGNQDLKLSKIHALENFFLNFLASIMVRGN